MLHLDFESRSEIDLRIVGSDKYSHHHSTDALCLAYAFDDKPVQLWKRNDPAPKEVLSYVEKGGKVVAHNAAGFEMLIWNNVMGLKYDWPELHIEQCIDPMAMAYAMGLPGSLDEVSKALGITEQKDVKGHRIMLQLCKPRSVKEGEVIWWEEESSPDKYEALYLYCMQDVNVERLIYKRLKDLYRGEQDVFNLDYKINRRGVYLDSRALEEALGLVEKEKTWLNNRIREVTSGEVKTCTSTAQIVSWLKSKSIDVESIAKANVVDMLKDESLPNEVKEVLLIRQEAALTSTAKLKSMIESTCIDNRVRGLFQYHGASTGRWAGRRIQLQNLPRPSLKDKDIDQVFSVLKSDLSDLGKLNALRKFTRPMTAFKDSIRGYLCAKPGYLFMDCDFSAIEARVIAWLAGEESILEVFRGDGKIYELAASSIFKCRIEDIKPEDPRRQVGKVAVLALGYQGGVGALQTMCRAYGISLEPAFQSLWDRATSEHKEKAGFMYERLKDKSLMSKKEFFASELIKQYWRESNQNIVRYWYNLEAAAIKAVNNKGEIIKVGATGREVEYLFKDTFLFCKLPSGRSLSYPYPQVKLTKKFDEADESETLTYMTVGTLSKKWERRKSYGGLLSENITQAVARDLLAEGLVRLENAGLPVVMHIHDEVVCEVKKEKIDLDKMKNILSMAPSWGRDLPIKVSGWTGERFKK